MLYFSDLIFDPTPRYQTRRNWQTHCTDTSGPSGASGCFSKEIETIYTIYIYLNTYILSVLYNIYIYFLLTHYTSRIEKNVSKYITEFHQVFFRSSLDSLPTREQLKFYIFILALLMRIGRLLSADLSMQKSNKLRTKVCSTFSGCFN